MKAVYVIDAVRSPVGKYGGVLQWVRPDDLLGHMIRALVERNPSIDVRVIEDVIAGAANQSGEDCRNVARMAALLAGLPVEVAGNTVNRLCASGLQAIMDASRAVMCGEGSIYIAGGVESMTRAPLVMEKSHGAWSRTAQVYDSTIGWRFTNQELIRTYPPLSMGETAENVAREWNISREQQDDFAFHSHRKYFSALSVGKWEGEIAPVNAIPGNEDSVVLQDEPPRRTTPAMLARLKPAFLQNGTVTAGNSSGINDGAAALLLADEDAIKKYHLVPLARVVSMAAAGVHPSVMGTGPVPAAQKALQRAGLTVHDIAIFELNEAFASTSIACISDLDIDSSCVNVNGGAIAIGNPLGSSGARIVTTLLHEMKRRGVHYGLAAMCAGLGQGAAVIFENVR